MTGWIIRWAVRRPNLRNPSLGNSVVRQLGHITLDDKDDTYQQSWLGSMDVQAAQKALMDALVDGLWIVKVTHYLWVAGYSLVVADYLHTLPEEVRLLWPVRMSIPKLLFLGTRYYIFVHIVFSILWQRTDLPPSVCKSGFDRLSVSCVVLIALTDGLMFLRVYAFSGKNRVMLAYLLFQFVGHNIAAYAIIAKYLPTVKFLKLPFSNVPCLPIETSEILLGAAFIVLFITAVIEMIVMLYLAYRKHKDLDTSLWKVCCKDGVLYFVALAILATLNIIVTFGASGGWKFLFVQMVTNLHVIFSTRLLLHLRSWAERDTEVLVWESAEVNEKDVGPYGIGDLGGIDYYSGADYQRQPSPPGPHESWELSNHNMMNRRVNGTNNHVPPVLE